MTNLMKLLIISFQLIDTMLLIYCVEIYNYMICKLYGDYYIVLSILLLSIAS